MGCLRGSVLGGFKQGELGRVLTSENVTSTTDNPGVVREYLRREREAGNLVGPVHQEFYPCYADQPFWGDAKAASAG